MRIDVLTLFPEMFSGYLGQSLVKRAVDAGVVGHPSSQHPRLGARQTAASRRSAVRRRAGHGAAAGAGGGKRRSGARQGEAPGHLVLLTPQGRRLNQRVVEELAGQQRLVLICGRYEGVDQRAIDLLAAG